LQKYKSQQMTCFKVHKTVELDVKFYSSHTIVLGEGWGNGGKDERSPAGSTSANKTVESSEAVHTCEFGARRSKQPENENKIEDLYLVVAD
jgi:hypothetical protein